MEKIPDLTTPENRQKEIDKVWQKEDKEEENKLEADNKPEFDLEKSRADYVKSYTEYRQAFGGTKKKEIDELEKNIEPVRKYIKVGDSKILSGNTSPSEWDDATKRQLNFNNELEKQGIKRERANFIYHAELKKAEYDAAKVEAGKKMAEQGIPQAEIFQKIFLQERELLNKQKVESWPPKEKGIFRKGMEWYMKRGTATRLLISTGLVTSVVAGVGGFGAAAAATYAGYRFVRGFGSVMVGKLAGKGVDMMMSRGIEAKKEAALEKLKSGFDLAKLKETEKELEKIFEETAKRERRKLLIKAGVSVVAGAGTAIGMGMLEHAWAGGVKVAPETITKPKVEIPKEMIPPKPAVESVVEVQKGDTVWKLAEEQLDKRGFFKDLTGSADEIAAKKNFLIDSISRKVDVSSGDANLIHAGEKIDFKDIFENKDIMAQLVDKSEHLRPMGASHVITTGAGKNVLELFDQQDRPEKWRTIQIYQDDIDSMKENLPKFKDPEVVAGIQKEIDRLEGVKHSLINRLAEQTEQTAPQVPAGAEKTAEAVANILPGEKQNFLDYLVYKDDRLVGFKVKTLVEQIKSDKLTAEDFSKYYASKIGAERVSDKMLDGFKYNFKAISGTNAVERLKAEGVMAALLKRLESIK